MKHIFSMEQPLMKVILYLACVAFIAFYLYVLYLGTKPDVSDQYRAYYIDHTVSEWTE